MRRGWQAHWPWVSGPAVIDSPKGRELPEDLRDAWAERAAIMECDGGLARPVAAHAAWRWLDRCRTAIRSGYAG